MKRKTTLFITSIFLLNFSMMAYAQTGGHDLFVLGEIIVKFKPEVAERVYDAQKAGGFSSLVAGSASLDRLNRKYSARDAKRVFSSLEIKDRQGNVIGVRRAKDVAQGVTSRNSINVSAALGNVPDFENVFLIQIDKKKDVLKAVDEYKRNPNVVYAEPVYIFEASRVELSPPDDGGGGGSGDDFRITPDDPLYPQQWALAMIDAEEAWTQFIDDAKIGKDVVIALIDTGIAFDHKDLAENAWFNSGELPSVPDINGDGIISLAELQAAGLTDRNGNGRVDPVDIFDSSFEDTVDNDGNGFVDDLVGWNFSPPVSNFPIGGAHGSHVAGIAAAVSDNTYGVAGVSWRSKIMALSAFAAVDSRSFTTDVANAIYYAVNNGADVINTSGGIGGEFVEFVLPESRLLEGVISYAANMGVIYVAASGNSPGSYYAIPAMYPDVIAVAGTNQQDNLETGFTLRNWVDVVAPGINILNVDGISGGHISKSGTSMASPHVAGAVALVLSYHENLEKNYSRVAKVRQIIKQSSDSVNIPGGIEFDGGRLNAHKAVLVNPDTVPVARLTFSQNPIDRIAGVVDITGTATANSFDNYSVHYKCSPFGPPSTETGQVGSTQYTPVENGVLISDWDTTTINDGRCELTLIVEDSLGHQAEHSNYFMINNNSPWIHGRVINIDGEGFENVQIRIEQNGTLIETVSTNFYGLFYVIGLLEGSYDLIPVHSMYRFSPIKQNVQITNGEIPPFISFTAYRAGNGRGQFTP